MPPLCGARSIYGALGWFARCTRLVCVVRLTVLQRASFARTVRAAGLRCVLSWFAWCASLACAVRAACLCCAIGWLAPYARLACGASAGLHHARG